MKKDIFKLNTSLYKAMFNISMFYTAFNIGQLYDKPEYWPDYFLFPGIFLAFLLISKWMNELQVFLKTWQYIAMAITSLLYVGAYWGIVVYGNNPRYDPNLITPRFDPWLAEILDYYVYPAVLSLFALIIAVGYLICCVKDWKEARRINKEI